MNRIFPLAIRVILVSGIGLALFGCGKTETTEDADKTEANVDSVKGEILSTPENTLAAAKAASKKGDDAKLCQYFTPTARQELAAGMVMMGGFMQAVIEKPTQNPKTEEKSIDEKDIKRAEAIKALFDKYELTKEKRPEININLNDSQEKQQEQMRKLADPIKDHCQFFADFVQLMRKYAESPDARMIEDNAKLENLKIDGDNATAEFVQSREGSERRSPIEFEKIGGQWLISEVPNLLN